MPVAGLSFDEGEVLFGGIPFNQLATSEKIRIGAAIACALNPTLRVMIVKDGSLLDDDALAVLAGVARNKGMQVWIERVGSDRHTSVVIEDGCVAEGEAVPEEGAAPARPAKPESIVDRIEASDAEAGEILAANEHAVNKYLIHLKWIAAGQTYRDLKDLHKVQVYSRPQAWVEKAVAHDNGYGREQDAPAGSESNSDALPWSYPAGGEEAQARPRRRRQ